MIDRRGEVYTLAPRNDIFYVVLFPRTDVNKGWWVWVAEVGWSGTIGWISDASFTNLIPWDKPVPWDGVTP